MKEHPIIFDSQSVRGILSGSKTQTRCVIKLPLDDMADWPFTGMRASLGYPASETRES